MSEPAGHPSGASAPIPKPDELLALHGVTTELFDTLRAWFDVPAEVAIDLRAVDSAVGELGDPVMIAALAMRKLQALHLLSTPGVRTTTDVVVAIVNDLQRALLQAPTMRLRVQAESTDWDQALAELDSPAAVGEGPSEADQDDPEISRFEQLHLLVQEAMLAVIQASGGEIRVLV